MVARRSAHLRLLRVLLVAVALFLVLGTVGASPSIAAAEGEEAQKTELPSNPHDQVGLIILAGVGVLAAAGAYNAFKQLRGERPQADGKIRWR